MRRDNDVDDDILKDGETMRVPVFLLDGSGGTRLNQPGFRTAADAAAADAAWDEARQQCISRMSNAWRGPSAARDEKPARTADEAYLDYVQRLENAWRNP
jgi:hypothetical protein